MEKKVDRRVRKTKESIRKAYLELQNENVKGNHITVTEIAKKADIDRKTFYLHYDSVEDILEEFCDEKIEELIMILKATEFFHKPIRLDLVFNVINKMVEKDVNIYKQLADNANYITFWKRVEDIMVKAIITAYEKKVSISVTELSLYANLFSSGLINIYTKWLKSEIDMSLDEISESVVHLAKEGIMHYLVV